MCCLAATSGDICGKFKLANIYNDSTAETNQTESWKHMSELKENVDVESKTSPLKRNVTSKSGTATEYIRENETRSKPVLCLNYSQSSQNEALETNDDITADL